MEAVQEAKSVIQRLNDERADQNVWIALFEKATEVGEEFEIPPSTSRRVGRQVHRMNHPINDPSEYLRVLLYLVFLDHLATEISSHVIKNEARFSGPCLVPNKLHTLTDQTTNSIFDSFRTDIGDRQAFLDEVRWKTRWNMVDGQKPQTVLEKLNVTNQDLYPNIYAIFTVLITMPVSSASSERSFSAMRRVKNCLRAKQWVMRDYQIYRCYTSTEQ